VLKLMKILIKLDVIVNVFQFVTYFTY